MSTMKERPLSTRQGLNCTLSYHHGQRYSYRCRVEEVAWGVRAPMDEAAGRSRRTAYPHRVTPAPFQIVVVLNGYFEFTDFRDFMMSYAGFTMDDQLSDHGTDRAMTVSVPSRRFLHKGILLTGISFGDHVGSMVWRIPYVFEPTSNPLERNSAARLSTYSFGTALGLISEARYFYPFGTQLRGDQQGVDYAEPTTPEPTDDPTPPQDPVDLPSVPSVPKPSGVRGDIVAGNPLPGPTAKTIPETIRIKPRDPRGQTLDAKIVSPVQALKKDGAIIGYKYVEVIPAGPTGPQAGGYAAPSVFDVFSSGNVVFDGQVIGQVTA